jgi:hypothetical protein
MARLPLPFFVKAAVADVEKFWDPPKSCSIPAETLIGKLIPAAPMVPPADQVIAAPKLIPTAVAIVPPVADPALLKFNIGPPVVTNAEVYGPAGFVLQTLPVMVPLVPK